MSRSLKEYLGKILFMAIVIPFAMSPSLFILLMLMLPACITEPRGKVSDLSGHDFEISDTNCDTLAKDDAINVFASKTGKGDKTLVFKYDPGGPMGDVAPQIRLIGPNKIRISVTKIASIFSWRAQLEDLYVVYDIGKIEYPDPRDPPRK